MEKDFDVFVKGNKVPKERVERGDIPVSKGMELPGQGVMEIMMPDKSVYRVTFRVTNHMDFTEVMAGVANQLFIFTKGWEKV